MRLSTRPASLYVHLLILFMVLLIPVQVIGMGMLISSSERVRETSMEKCERTLSSAVDFLTNDVETIFERAHIYLFNSESNVRQPFQYSVRNTPSEWWITLRNIMNDQAWLLRSNDAAREIRLYYPALGLWVSNSGYGVATDDDVCKYVPEGRANGLLQYVDGDMAMSLAYPSSIKSGSIRILLNVFLDADAMRAAAEEKAFAGDCLLYLNGECLSGADEARERFADALPASGDRLALSGGDCYAFVASEGYYGLTLVNVVPAAMLDAASDGLNTLFAIYAALSAAIIIVYAFALRRIVRRPMQSLLIGFDGIRRGSLDTRVESRGPGGRFVPSEFARLMDGFNRMAEHLNEAVQTIYEQKLRTQQIEFKQLQSQINPHFLYNTFFMLERMVDDDDSDAARATCRYLGDYFRYITYSGSSTTCIRDEYAHATNYMMLQKMRFENRLDMEFPRIPDDIAETKVPRLIFQPILENMFNHGFSQSVGLMRVRVRIETGDALSFIFENSADAPPESALALDLDSQTPDGETTGLTNIHRRIRLYFGKPYGVALSQSELGGLAVMVTLPRVYGKE